MEFDFFLMSTYQQRNCKFLGRFYWNENIGMPGINSVLETATDDGDPT